MIIFVTFNIAYAEILRVRVIVSRANIRQKPSLQSSILTQVSKGITLPVIKVEGDWYFVKLPPDEKGTEITGYIHKSIVEVVEEVKEATREQKEKEVKEEKKVEVEKEAEKVSEKAIEKPLASQEKKTVEIAKFIKGGKYFTPQIGINAWTIPFGVHFEYGLTENIGICPSVLMWLWGEEYWTNTLVDISTDIVYHFTQIKADKIDLFAGAGLGFAIYSWRWKSGFEWMTTGGSGNSGLFLYSVLGGRYFFSKNTAVHLRLIGSFLIWAGFGGTIGISFGF
jgi:hypothetical protein